MDTPSTMPEEAAQAPAKIMFVDDEANILSSLRRLFRSHGYEIFTADSGSAGLTILETEPIDLVISDMRMPGMDGASFLEHVRHQSPDTVRLLLTGYSDIQSILDAINRGEIYRYITKPWDDNDIVLIVRQALERRALEQEKRRLEALALRQNEELKALNASLEAKVAARTVDLQTANGKLKTSFLTSIKVFSNLIEMRGTNLAGHSRRVADLSRKIAAKMGLDAQQMQEVFVAGLLHNIGCVAFSDEMLSTPVSLMKGDKLGIFRKHPIRAQQLLMPLEDLSGVATILRSQLERFDGEGFPDRLSDMNIPTGARILALASDYDNLQIGTLVPRRLQPEEAAGLIMQGRGTRYDPHVVIAFQDILKGGAENAQEVTILVSELKPGMIVARDLIAGDGFMLLPADHVLDVQVIKKIMDFEASTETKLTVWIRKG